MKKKTTINAWTEDMIISLGQDEYDFQEFKASPYLADENGINSNFTILLSKQVSAFANGGGGRIVIGLDDEGKVDGGVSTTLKGGGTRAWLEDVISDLVTPKLRNFNVFEVTPTRSESAILAGSAVYVISINESPDAPHQAMDKRYYLRIAGKSRPMGHVHIQDVFRRTRNPRVELSRLSPYGVPELDTTDPRGERVFVQLHLYVQNNGQRLARHVGAEILLPREFVGREVKRRTLNGGELDYTQTPSKISFFRYHPNPIFPGQELFFMRAWIGIHKTNSYKISGKSVKWRIYADDARPLEGEIHLMRYKLVRKALHILKQ
jgi:hypothetical protein